MLHGEKRWSSHQLSGWPMTWLPMVKAGLGFFSFQTAWRTLRGYETMHMIWKGQVQVSGIQDQVKFVNSLFRLAA
jgi:hypothetical protein